MNTRRDQSGSVHLIIIAILSLALIGTLGFVFYQNFIQNKTNTAKTSEANTSEESTKTTTAQTTPAVAPATVVNNFLTSFLSYMGSSTAGHTEAAFAAQSTVLTDSYADSIINPKGMVAVSPIILAQNIPASFTIGTVTTTSTSSSVPVTFAFTPPSNVVYKLVIVNNEWKIDGVTKA